MVWSTDSRNGWLHQLDPRTGVSVRTAATGVASRFATPALHGRAVVVGTMTGVRLFLTSWPPGATAAHPRTMNARTLVHLTAPHGGQSPLSSTSLILVRRADSVKGFSMSVTPASSVPWEARTGWA